MDEGDARRRRPDHAGPDADAADLQAIARDWIALWQSEIAATVADREWQEAWQRLAALWAGAAAALVSAMPRGADDGSSGAPGTAPSSRPAPAAAAPDPRDAEIERLVRRIDALERRMAELEGAGRSGGTGTRRKSR
jgi:hypothetical protein